MQVLSQIAHIAVRLARCVTRDGQSALGVAKREGQTALPLHDRANLPAANHAVHDPVHMTADQLVSAEREVPLPIRRERAAADVGVVSDDGLLVPRSKVTRIVPTTLVGVVEVDAEPLRKRLGELGLNRVVMGVLVIPVVADALGPITRPTSAGRQSSVCVPLQQRRIPGTAGRRHT